MTDSKTITQYEYSRQTQKAYRDRIKRAGYVFLQIICKPEHKEEIREYARKLEWGESK